MHTFGNHIFGNNRRRKLILHNPFGENLHISTLLSVLLASFCDNGKTIGILIEVFLHTLFQCTDHVHHNVVRLYKLEKSISIRSIQRSP